LRRAIADDLRHLREDVGLSQVRLAAAAGVAQSELSDLEAARSDPGLEVLARLSAALGGRLAVRIDPGIGSPVRDHIQATMIEGFLPEVAPCWRRLLEVTVYRPVRGVIDLVLDDPSQHVAVATEVHSELRRIEQQLRWATAKADALATADPSRTVSRLLLLRATPRTRATVAEFSTIFATAYPANHREAVAALRGSGPWPGAALLWMGVQRGPASLRDAPPRGINLGR
jgi:transcriptional regulator with XRE-family HTH domain